MSNLAPTRFERFLHPPMELQLQAWRYAAVAIYQPREKFNGDDVNPAVIDTAYCDAWSMAQVYNNPACPLIFKNIFEDAPHPVAALMRFDTRKSLLSVCYMSRMVILQTWKADVEAMVLEIERPPVTA